MSDIFYLGLRYILSHRLKLAALTLAITLVGWLPIAIQTMVDETAEGLLDRADATPLVIGAPGSQLELALGSLYFRSRSTSTLPFAEVERLNHLAAELPSHRRVRDCLSAVLVGHRLSAFAHRRLG